MKLQMPPFPGRPKNTPRMLPGTLTLNPTQDWNELLCRKLVPVIRDIGSSVCGRNMLEFGYSIPNEHGKIAVVSVTVSLR